MESAGAQMLRDGNRDNCAKGEQCADQRNTATEGSARPLQRDEPEADVKGQQQHFRGQPAIDKGVLADNEHQQHRGKQQRRVDDIRHQAQSPMVGQRGVVYSKQPASRE